MPYKQGQDPDFDRYIRGFQTENKVKFNAAQVAQAHEIYKEELAKHVNRADSINVSRFFERPEEQAGAPPPKSRVESLQTIEQYMLQGLPELAEKHKTLLEQETMKLEENRIINAQYPGKVRIATATGSGKVIEIHNKSDMELLKMKYRKEVLDPLVQQEIAQTSNTSHEDNFDWE